MKKNLGILLCSSVLLFSGCSKTTPTTATASTPTPTPTPTATPVSEETLNVQAGMDAYRSALLENLVPHVFATYTAENGASVTIAEDGSCEINGEAYQWTLNDISGYGGVYLNATNGDSTKDYGLVISTYDEDNKSYVNVNQEGVEMDVEDPLYGTLVNSENTVDYESIAEQYVDLLVPAIVGEYTAEDGSTTVEVNADHTITVQGNTIPLHLPTVSYAADKNYVEFEAYDEEWTYDYLVRWEIDPTGALQVSLSDLNAYYADYAEGFADCFLDEACDTEEYQNEWGKKWEENPIVPVKLVKKAS